MSDFKDQVERDIGAVFLNPDELAETMHVVYGSEFNGNIPVTLDESVQNDRPESSRVSERIDGIYQVTTMFYAAKSDMGVVPQKERQLVVGDTEYTIITSTCDMGMIALGLRRYDE